MGDLDNFKFIPREYGIKFSISRTLLDEPGPYGYYRRPNGKYRIRNYHRNLKNGKGFSVAKYILDRPPIPMRNNNG